MLEALDISEAEAAGLSELAALDLAMARRFAERAQAEEDPEVASDLARSYQRMARSYRQTLALKIRLQHDAIRAAREAPPRPPAPVTPPSPGREVRVEAREGELRTALCRVAWAEYEAAEGPEADPDEALADYAIFLDERIGQLAREPGFARQPLDEHVAALARQLDLDPGLAARWRALPDPPDEAFAESGWLDTS